jgi:hypothetical protein
MFDPACILDCLIRQGGPGSSIWQTCHLLPEIGRLCDKHEPNQLGLTIRGHTTAFDVLRSVLCWWVGGREKKAFIVSLSSLLFSCYATDETKDDKSPSSIAFSLVLNHFWLVPSLRAFPKSLDQVSSSIAGLYDCTLCKRKTFAPTAYAFRAGGSRAFQCFTTLSVCVTLHQVSLAMHRPCVEACLDPS